MALTCSVTAGVYALGKLNAMDEKLDSSESRPGSKAKDAVRYGFGSQVRHDDIADTVT
jgi:hypothetical protein